MTDRVGQQLGNYQLLRLLGEGGFAEVYLGEHIHLGTHAAIKVLHTQLTSDDVDKFRTEARTIARLIHPHIVRVLEFGIEGKTPFLVMDYAPNGTLRQRHPKGTLLPLDLVVSYVKQVADALQYAHDEKLIHRDVKPENMLLGRRNEILLSDFGIALVAQSSRYQSAQEMAGTMAYMAPEQIQGKPRPASDQYSLGIVVYEWLSGDRPFHGSLTELVGQHLSAPPPSLQEKVSTILPEVDQVVLTALAKDPKLRYANVKAFASALERVNHSVSANIFPSDSPSQFTRRDEEVASAKQTVLFPEPPPLAGQTSFSPTSSITPTKSSPMDSAEASSPQSFSIQPQMDNMLGEPTLPNRSASPPSIASIHSSSSTPPNKDSLSPSLVTDPAHVPSVSITEPPARPTESIASSITSLPSHLIALPNRLSSLKRSFGTDYRVFSKSKAALLIVVVLLMVGGSIGLRSITVNNRLTAVNATATTNSTNVHASATANALSTVSARVHATANTQATASARATTTASALVDTNTHAYSTATTNGVMFGFNAQHTHFNSAEHILAPANVSQLVLDWMTPTGGIIGSEPAVANGIVYVGSYDHKLYAFNAATGATLWTASTGGIIGSSPAVVKDIVYVGSEDYHLYAFNATAGATLWSAFIGNFIVSSPAIANGVVYVGSQDHKLYAFNATTGTTLWTASTGDIIYSSPAIANSVVYVGSRDHKLYAFNAATGGTLWSASTGEAIDSSPAVANGVVYVGSYDRRLYAFNAATGGTLWSAFTGSVIHSGPTVASGVVYVGSADHMLYAFHLPT